jgi:DNA-dependent RNA polymerase auxiliary subunit epsilon
MQSFDTNWSKKEFLAYLLLYVAQSDFVESPEEQALIKTKIGKEKYESIHLELDADNDFQSLQKIVQFVKSNNYSEDEIDKLVEEIMELFKSDGAFTILEKNMLRGLEKLLRNKP